jgi:YD repeat-containing protein
VCHGGKDNGPGPGCTGNPCNAANGNKLEVQPIYQGLNGFELTLTYNTQDDDTSHFGRRWRDTFDRRIYRNANGTGTTTFAYRPDGKSINFALSGAVWVPDADTSSTLTQQTDANGVTTGWQLQVAAGDEVETYDATGNLLTIRSRTGLVQTLSYSDGTSGPNGGVYLDANGQPTTSQLPVGFLIRAADNFGRTLVFAYDINTARVAKITDPAGGAYRFTYDSRRNLTSISFPDSATRTFLYNESANTGGAAFPWALTGIIDENGSRFATFKYDAQERAISTEHAGGVQRYTFSYSDNSTTVTDPLGTSRTYGLQTILGSVKIPAITGPACPSCGPASRTFDANGNVSSRTDWNGNVTVYSYDLARNLETSRTDANGTPQARTVTRQWHPTFRLQTKVAEPLRITTYVYNGDGGAQCGFQADGSTLVPGVLCSKTEQATTDATGAAGFSATPTGTPRISTYTYNANGSVLTMDGPRTDLSDVTATAYYSNTDADTGKRGNAATTTNALGHVASITAYDAHGHPLTIVDPNGMITSFAYDARQRLTSRNVGGEVTTYAYDGVGQITQVSLPDGSFLSYGYDAAHRLTGMSDSLGNRVAYTLDAMGNRIQEQRFDPANALAQTRSRVFNNLNQLVQEIGAQGQTTQYGYDNQGNIVSVSDPLNQVTSNQYDALNRLIRVTDPNLGQTQYAYNGNDKLFSVTDPRSLATTYDYDGLSNLKSLISPATGSTTNTYDAAGNQLSQSDAKGQATTYTYDALNRVTSIALADGSKQSYVYDLNPNGIGRLTSVTELDPAQQATSVIAYGYDLHGRTTSETRTINGVQYALGYTYDSFGRLSGLTYPSGRTISYLFDGLGRIAQVSTTPSGGSAQLVASSIVYRPFGGVQGYTLGNGQTYARGFDLDGRIASYTEGAQTFAIGYDAASRVSFIADTANAASTNTYSYDPLSRLTGAVIPSTPIAYAYDAVGNRTSKTVGSATDTYSPSATSNQISSITSLGGAVRNFTFDANGSTTNDGINQYAYDTRGRMVQSTGALGVTNYQVNALGERIRKTNSSDDRVFLYDTWGHLIAETDPGGGLKREYLYLNDIPLAVIQ